MDFLENLESILIKNSQLLQIPIMNVAFSSEIELDDKVMSWKIKGINRQKRRNIRLRTIVGHAVNGHSIWKNIGKKVNTTLEEIVEVLEPDVFYDESQEIIDQIGGYILQSINSHPYGYIKLNNFLINDMSIFQNVMAWPFLVGFYFGSNFDLPKIRRLVRKEYDIGLGFGEVRLFFRDNFKLLNINLDEFASDDYTKYSFLNRLNSKEKINLFEKIGLIKKKKKINFSRMKTIQDLKKVSFDYSKIKKNFFQGYIRLQKGFGISDDIACMNASFLGLKYLNKIKSKNVDYGNYFRSFMVGANFADLIDTITKGTRFYIESGFDSAFGSLAEKLFEKRLLKDKKYRNILGYNLKDIKERLDKNDSMLVSKKDLVGLTALSIHPYKNFFGSCSESSNVIVHSSLRNFFEYDNDGKNKISVIEKEYFFVLKYLNNYLSSKGVSVQPSLYNHIYMKGMENGCRIGFHKIKFKKVKKYLQKFIFPTLTSFITSEAPNRENIIKKIYDF